MKNLIHYHHQHNALLHFQGDEIVRRTTTQLHWTNVYLVSAEAEVKDILELQWLANYICHECNRVVVIASQSEFTHLIVAKSNNVSFLYANEIITTVSKKFGGTVSGDASLAYLTLNKLDVVPELIDEASVAIIVAIPYHGS